MVFKNHYNREQFPDDGEVNTLPSETIPDQSMSVREILLRHSRGLSAGGGRVPIYEGEEEFMPELANMDLAERQEYLEGIRDEIVEIKAKMAEAERKRRLVENEKLLQEKIDEFMKDAARQKINDRLEDSQKPVE